MLKSPKWFLWVVTAVLVSSMPVYASQSQSWQDSFNKGESALLSNNPKAAEDDYRKALSLVKKQSKSAGDTDKCMQRLANTLALIDKTEESRSIYINLLKRLSSRYGKRSTQIEPVLMALGSIQESLGNHTKAMNYYNRALRINEKNYGTYSPAYAGTLSRLGRVNRKMGNSDEAKAHYKQAISILSKKPNQQAAKQLKGVMHEYGDLIKDEDHSNRDLINDFQKDILRNTDSDNKSSYKKGDDNLGSKPQLNRIATKDIKQSDTKYNDLKSENASVENRLKPKIGAETSTVSRASGWTQGSRPTESQWQKEKSFQLKALRQKDTDENREVALRGFPGAQFSKTLNPAYEVVSDTIFNQKRYEGDERQYKRKIAIDIDALGPNHPSVANDLNALAQLYVSQKKFEEARPILTKALAIYESTYGLNNLLSINTLSSLAKVEFRLGDYENAAKHYKRALGHGQSALGPNSIETAKILNGLAYLYFYQGKLNESATFYRWAVSSTESALGEEDPLLAACLKDYAQVLRRLGQDTKANQVEVRATSILAKAK